MKNSPSLSPSKCRRRQIIKNNCILMLKQSIYSRKQVSFITQAAISFHLELMMKKYLLKLQINKTDKLLLMKSFVGFTQEGSGGFWMQGKLKELFLSVRQVTAITCPRILLLLRVSSEISHHKGRDLTSILLQTIQLFQAVRLLPKRSGNRFSSQKPKSVFHL